MPELKDGKVVYSDAEMAAAQQANDSTEAARLAQVKADADSANAIAMQKLAMQSAQIEQTKEAERAAAEKALADAQPASGDA